MNNKYALIFGNIKILFIVYGFGFNNVLEMLKLINAFKVFFSVS